MMFSIFQKLQVATFVTAAVLTGLGNSSAYAEEPRQENRLVAQDYVPTYCGEFESTFVAVETDNFFVSICGGDLPGSYVGVDKVTGDSIRLPLSDYSMNGNYFEAVNGDYVYILSKTPRGNFLTVSLGAEELLREYTWQDW